MARTFSADLFSSVRNQYPVFNYENFILNVVDNDVILEFNFNIDEKFYFKPRTQIKTGILVPGLAAKVHQHRKLLENIAFHIGMIELLSYWKATCSPTINIKPAKLTSEQAEWWKKLYFNGLGEFLWLNSIETDIETFVQFNSSGTFTHYPQTTVTEEKFLVPIGGGKDSAVTLSLLMNEGKPVMPLIMNPRGATTDTVLAAGLSTQHILVINRTIDKQLLELNEQGFLNGHTPFSAMLAFYTLFCAVIAGFRYIPLSNESSASESTIPGTNINHQYSKSLEFETDFRNYYKKFITPDIDYFSLLRPLNELQIASIFSGLTKYHEVFRSCNAGSKTNHWCGKCPKCMFTHIMLSAFLGIDEADRIIGSAMLDNMEMSHIFDELTGFSAIKPFECIGTTTEVKQALQMILSNQTIEPLPRLLQRFKKINAEKINPPDFSQIEEPHFVPEGLVTILKQNLS